MASCKTILLFSFIFMSSMLDSASSSIPSKTVNAGSQRSINDFVMKYNEKLDYLNDRVDQLEFNSTKGNNVPALDVREIILNLTHLIISSSDTIIKRIEKFEQKFENMEESFKKIEKFEEKLNVMEVVLLRVLNASGNGRERKESNVWSEVTSFCHDKVATWANSSATQFKANLERINFCNESQQEDSINVCHPNPCLYGGRCQSSSTGSEFKCVDCPKRTSGSRCENVQCSKENRCWRLNDTLYIAFETELTWFEAKDKCENEGMSLVMPKNQEKTEFLVTHLKSTYKTYPRYWLWMGIKKDNDESAWRWVDGSGLGEYTGGWAGMKNKAGFSLGALWIGDGIVLWGFADIVHKSYPLCEFQLLTN